MLNWFKDVRGKGYEEGEQSRDKHVKEIQVEAEMGVTVDDYYELRDKIYKIQSNQCFSMQASQPLYSNPFLDMQKEESQYSNPWYENQDFRKENYENNENVDPNQGQNQD